MFQNAFETTAMHLSSQ